MSDIGYKLIGYDMNENCLSVKHDGAHKYINTTQRIATCNAKTDTIKQIRCIQYRTCIHCGKEAIFNQDGFRLTKP